MRSPGILRTLIFVSENEFRVDVVPFAMNESHIATLQVTNMPGFIILSSNG
tara:strand:+ start:267 stop:419 length:153 start_codon:yes stop_codon:yes gene_type:complete